MKASVENRIVLGFAASIVALLSMGWLLYSSSQEFVHTERLVSHTHEVIADLETGLATLSDAESSQRAFLLTGDKSFLDDCRASQKKISGWTDHLRALTADNSEQQQNIRQLETLVQQRLSAMNSIIELRQQKGLEVAAADVVTRNGSALMEQIHQTIANMRSVEIRLLNARQQAAHDNAQELAAIVLIAGIVAAVIGLAAIIILRKDLSARRRVERALGENEKRLRLMVDSVKDYAIFMLDPRGYVVSWNTGAQNIKGYAPNEIIGQHFSKFYIPEAVRDGMPEKVLGEAKEKGRFEGEGWRVRKDGSRFWADVVVTAIHDSDGQLLGFVKVVRDLSERRRSQQAREERDRFFDLSSDMICIAGFDGYFKTVNPAWEQALGFSPQELLAKPFLHFVHPDDRVATQIEAEKLYRGGETLIFENRYLCKNGSYRNLAWSARSDIEKHLIYATARDVTVQKEAQDQIMHLNDDLRTHSAQMEVLNKELESFSYSVSHDLRAPLRHIDGFVKLLDKTSKEKLDERSQRYLNIIADATRQMGALIDDLLVFSRMGRAELRQTKVASDSLVHEAMDVVKGEVENRHVNWKLEPLPEVTADPAMLRQVWINLIANAVKYTRPRDPAEIEIGTRDSNNGEFIFFVRDNGVGFDMQYAHKLFGVFQRLHRADEFEGTGIGLANVQRIVHRHGGRVWAESKLNEGSTFYFSLPKREK